MRTTYPTQAQLEHAVALLVRMNGGCVQGAQQATQQLDQWRLESPAHEMAYRMAQAAWNAADFQDLQSDIPLPGDQRTLQGRRRALQTLAVGALALLGGRYLRSPQHADLSLVTVRAQVLRRHLRDGTMLTLAPMSRVSWFSKDTERLLELEDGEIYVDVAKDLARPFIVSTDWGQVRVLGTAFSVETSKQGMTVQVERGRVQLERADLAASFLYLSAGQGAVIDSRGLQSVPETAVKEVAAWRDGWLVFDNLSLAQVVRAWNRYLPAPLVLGPEAALSGHHLTGRFPVKNPDTFLLSLPGILPVRLEAMPHGGWMIRSVI